MAPAPITPIQKGAAAYPARLRPVRRQLAASRPPTFQYPSTAPAPKLDTTYPVVKDASRGARASRGNAKLARSDGHATPSKPSGSPRLTKARKLSARSAKDRWFREPLTAGA